MSAVLLAIFPDYDVASRIRLALFEDGFPTDRIELTATEFDRARTRVSTIRVSGTCARPHCSSS